MPVQSVASAPATSTPGSADTSVTTGLVQNVTIAAANVEQSHSFPANTKSFMIEARGNGKIRLAFSAGQSGLVFKTIWAGAFYRQDEISAALTTIYFQSPVAGLVIELTSWS